VTTVNEHVRARLASALTIRLSASIALLVLLPLAGCGDTHSNEMERPLSSKPNRTIIAKGLGRLPQFAHATVAGELIFVSGTLGTVGEGFDLAPGGTGPETAQTLRNIETILRAAGAELSDIVKVSVYLSDMSTFPDMNKAYSEFFGDEPPARITVGGADLALGAAVEIECIARVAN
jgi:2-iminobutanoate/2-iminopropanoate deaminase